MLHLASVEKDTLAKQAVERYSSQAMASKTIETYTWAQRDFLKWASQNGHETAFPIHPRVIAQWIAQTAQEGLCAASCKVLLSGIGYWHREQGFDNPTQDAQVKLVSRGIRRSKGTKVEKKAALQGEHIALMVRGIKKNDKAKIRDSAILLIGFSGGFRRSELIDLKISESVFNKKGVKLLISKSKTDQEGEGREVFIRRIRDCDICPVEALEAWLRIKPVSERLFPFCGRTIADLVKRRARAVGIDPRSVSAHSLRSGFITSAALAGKNERAIMQIVGHKNVQTMRGYIQGEFSDANEGLIK